MPQLSDLVTLTESGLYCRAGDFYIDPWKPVAKAVITHAHGDHARTGHKFYAAHPSAEGVMRTRLGSDIHFKGYEYGEAFSLGDTQVSLHPAGHVLGSAQVKIVHDGQTWVVSGDYKRNADPTCAPFEVVPCDTFITEATFAAPIYRWVSGEEIAQDILSWWQHCQQKKASALLFCYAFGKAQRILAELGRLVPDPKDPVLLHGAVDSLVQKYRDEGVEMIATQKLDDSTKASDLAGRLVLAPPSAYRSAWMRRFKNFETGFASGWVRVRGALRQRGHDRGFVLSDHADWPDLVRTVEETAASRVLVTHGRTDILTRHLQERGINATALKTAFGSDGEDD